MELEPNIFDIISLNKKYMNYLKINRLSEATKKNYQVTLNQFSNYIIENKGSHYVEEDQLKDIIEGFLSALDTDTRQYKTRSINAKRNALTGLFKYANEEEIIQVSVSHKLKALKIDTTQEKPILRKHEIDKVLKLLDQEASHTHQETYETLEDQYYQVYYKIRNRFLIHLFLYTGLRISEAAKVMWDDFNLDSKLLTITGKGNKTRWVPLNSQLMFAFFKYKTAIDRLGKTIVSEALKMNPSLFHSKYLFPSLYRQGQDTPLTTRRIAIIIEDILERTGINGTRNYEKKITPHSLRHTFATYLLDSGVPVRIVSDILGHRRTSTTFDNYIQIINKNRMFDEIEKLNY
ncbi:tyrosine-type recombinase/integrase [Vallitalea pronyensis]|uniref:Tyrosine-type recombinase/integrase n=1 Tax=Vallitalea pronyensis TaxID=1348613 RepID=A0A8J8MKH0_9FIRM|nr:tyrosine-type recombinase/integrase [Vallitalea pronyensis]QUI23375.1 tyrosine-type recombinase/integrase [Vallitalea pronyensis]